MSSTHVLGSSDELPDGLEARIKKCLDDMTASLNALEDETGLTVTQCGMVQPRTPSQSRAMVFAMGHLMPSPDDSIAAQQKGTMQ